MRGGYEAGEWSAHPQLNGVGSAHGYGPHQQVLPDEGAQELLPHSRAVINKQGYLLASVHSSALAF